MSKQFGLILPGAKLSAARPKPAIFESDSDSDVQEAKKPTSASPGVHEKRQARRIQEKALDEDPTVFQYDELYEAIESRRIEEQQAKGKDARNPKYISRLLECAERRKLEYERRLERTVQKEREKEGAEFADKESFVTSAYRLKLEELKQAEEREKREDYLEAIGDVTKQQDLGGFYRHLYEQKLKTKGERDHMKEIHDNSEASLLLKGVPASKVQGKSGTRARAYRKRHASDDEAGDISSVKKGTANKSHLQSNLDADSDFSIDESTDSESDDKNICHNEEKPKRQKAHEKVHNETEEKLSAYIELNGQDDNQANISIKTEPEEQKEHPRKPENEFKTKKDIWKKRTVGVAFEDALARYYERKSARNG